MFDSIFFIPLLGAVTIAAATIASQTGSLALDTWASGQLCAQQMLDAEVQRLSRQGESVECVERVNALVAESLSAQEGEYESQATRLDATLQELGVF